MKVIGVKFKGAYTEYTGKEYHFYTTLEDIVVGDYVVAICSNGMQICKVTSVDCQNTKTITACITQKVDTEGPKQYVEILKKKATIKSKMEKRTKELQEKLVWKMLAQEDEEMKNLLEQYSQL